MTVDAAAQFLQGHEKRWMLGNPPVGAPERLAASLDCRRLTARVLLARGHDLESARDFLEAPGEAGWLALDGIEVAAQRIESALRRGERIFIHGDYDVDGITAAITLRTAIEALGGHPDVFLPHRIHDGYGIAIRGIDAAKAAGARLFMTADCGASAAEAVEELARSGCDCIITDHHEQEAPIPAAVAVLNPHQPGASGIGQDLAAAGVAYQLALCLLDRASREVPPVLHAIAAIGTVADVVPLRGVNRRIVRRGLAALSQCGNPGLTGLMLKAGVDPHRATAHNIAFQIAPRLNAAGRLDDPMKAFELFVERDPSRLHARIEELDLLNRRRQEIEEEILGQAIAAVDLNACALVPDGEGWDRGVIGIVASRLVDRYHRPAFVISRQGDIAYGSARSVPGINLAACLRDCSDVLLAHGGHELAAGFSLHSEKLPLARARFLEAVDRTGVRYRPEIAIDSEIEPSDLQFETAEDLRRLEPFGQSNPEPIFLLRGAVLQEASRRVGNKHLRMNLRAGARAITGMAWRKAAIWDVPHRRPVDLAVRLQLHEYQGLTELRLQVEDFRLAG